uniref:Non-disulfide-bridged peptide androcin 10-1 n=1 Tax=Androctonus bicolor TaxID=748906 RepID=A0A0K0LCH4_9SCOR|nr:Non-disulfide-bridged peptide androcin 10-1 [Androctonus bicolor]
MKSQVFFLLFLVVLLLATTQSEVFVFGLLKSLFGKRGMSDMDTMKYLYDPSLSAADLKTLQKLMEDY